VSVYVVSLTLAASSSGCATMRYPRAYKIEGKEYKEFKELDDERALKVVALIYNVKHEVWEDDIARSLALEEYLGLLAKRKSKYIKDSGIFDIKYEKAKISTWEDEDLVKLYDTLAPKADAYYIDSARELTETKNAERIVYLTAVNVIVKELKKRDITRKVVLLAGQVLTTALTVALSLI
jgi:hypothetical protein